MSCYTKFISGKFVQNVICNKHEALLSAPFNVFLMVSCHWFSAYVTESIFCYRNFFLLHTPISVAQSCFCDGNIFLWQKLISVTETCFLLSQKLFSFVTETFFLWHKLNSVTETYFSGRNLILWQKLVSLTESYYSDRNMFLWQKLVYVTETYFCWKSIVLLLFTHKFKGKDSVRDGSFRYLG